ncbi:MAG: SDR family oxidoreductase [Planctomycetota bacterium]
MTRRPTVLVTGGARRVGAAIARAFARDGCDIVLHYNTSQVEANQLATSLTEMGAKVTLWKADLSEPARVEVAARELAAKLAELSVLILNASSYDRTPLDTVTATQAMSAYAVNAVSPLMLCKTFAGLLSASPVPGGGSIVAMGDMHATGRPRKGLAAYSMSKAALIEMVQTLARELAPKVRVNAVAPGVIDWPETGSESEAEMQRAYLSRVPLGRAGTPEDAAGVVRWLALEATYVTGEVIRVDGGRWLA